MCYAQKNGTTLWKNSFSTVWVLKQVGNPLSLTMLLINILVYKREIAGVFSLLELSWQTKFLHHKSSQLFSWDVSSQRLASHPEIIENIGTFDMEMNKLHLFQTGR